MFHIEFDRHYKLAWARFSGELRRDDIGTFDRTVALFIATEGCAHFVLDFTAVESVAMPDEALFERGKRQHKCPGFQRVVVAPQPEIFGLYRLFSANQSRIGSEAPLIVKTMEHALIHLGVAKPDFVLFKKPASPEESRPQK